MLRIELEILQQWISTNSRVLDLGCGDGTLLQSLKETKNIEGYGLEIDHDKITACIKKNVNVIETDIDKGLAHFNSDSFDTVVMTNSLQALKRPDRTLEEMLNIGKECIVTFPNFGNIRARFSLALGGKMPVTRQLAFQWYNTPNIHFCTVKDFESLCEEKNIRILHQEMVTERIPDRQLKEIWPNLFTETAVYHLSKQ